MWGSRTKIRGALISVFALVFMTVGLATASVDNGYGASITAESTGCETVTIHYDVTGRTKTTITFDDDIIGGNGLDDLYGDQVVELPGFNAQGTVNGMVKNTNGFWNAQLVFTNVEPGLANWSGSMWWDYGSNGDDVAEQGQYFNQGTVDVDPCPATTTPTTQPGDTTTSTIGQVETDLPDSAGPGLGLMAAMAAIGVSLLGGAALVAARREN